jgi:hypothetical protein
VEDGFMTIDEAQKRKKFPEGYVTPFPDLEGVPFIHGPEHPEFPQEGDWIVTGHNGARFVVRPDEFERAYELVEETVPEDTAEEEEDGDSEAENQE